MTEVASKIEEKLSEYNMETLMELHKTKSGVIRYLHSEGLTKSEILKTMKTMFPNFIYQHVRNVINTPIKKQ